MGLSCQDTSVTNHDSTGKGKPKLTHRQYHFKIKKKGSTAKHNLKEVKGVEGN